MNDLEQDRFVVELSLGETVLFEMYCSGPDVVLRMFTAPDKPPVEVNAVQVQDALRDALIEVATFPAKE